MEQTLRRATKIEDVEAPNLDEGSGRPFLRKLHAGVGDAARDVDRPSCPGKEFWIAYKHCGTLGGLVQGSDNIRLLDPCRPRGH